MYLGIAGEEKGICINDCDAYQYAIEQLNCNKELQKEFVEYFYSGNWIYKEEEVWHT